jgi:hypothetical protein
VNPVAVTIAVLLVAGVDSPLFSAVARVTVEALAVTGVFLNYALFVQIVPVSPKQAAARILVEVSTHLVASIVVVAASDCQILEVIVRVSSAVVTTKKSKHFSYCITALLLMHIKP